MAGVYAKVVVLVLVLVAMASAAPGVKICRGVTCPTSYMPGNSLQPNPNDACSFCQCVWGTPVIQPCAAGLGWNKMYSQCVPNPWC